MGRVHIQLSSQHVFVDSEETESRQELKRIHLRGFTDGTDGSGRGCKASQCTGSLEKALAESYKVCFEDQLQTHPVIPPPISSSLGPNGIEEVGHLL